MYVAVKGGEKAIDAAHRHMAEDRRGDPSVALLSVSQIRQQLSLAVDRVMTEGSLYDPDLAALAIKQARGDLVEAIFLLRAYRTTLPRLAVSRPINTAQMAVSRRISATFKDLPGGQILGPTFDYTHRLLDFALMAEEQADGERDPACDADVTMADARSPAPAPAPSPHYPRVADALNHEGLMATETADEDAEAHRPVGDITRSAPSYPARRDQRLQALARADEGWLLGLGYSTQRGYAKTHPFAGEIRTGPVEIEIIPEELGFPVCIGELTVTECDMVTQFSGSKTQPPQFSRGYGLAFGEAERKAMAMSLVDRALKAGEMGEDIVAPAQDQEFVLSHADNVEASGFVQHLKLPHYVDFQGELATVRQLLRDQRQRASDSSPAEPTPPDDDDTLMANDTLMAQEEQ